jgi:glycosyltransferase involved in cell wall biosynthesis
MTNSVLSYVVPTRDRAAFIRDCLDSCLAQQVAGAEVIVVDGGSTDDTRQILESYGDRIRWISEPDRGQADALNKGVAMATGDIIAWLNSDDYYSSAYVLPCIVKIFQTNPSIDIVYGDGLWVDVNGVPFRRHFGRKLAKGSHLLRHPSNPLMQPAVFFRRELYLRVGGARTALHWGLDYELWMRLFPAARGVRYVPKILACARCHSSAKTFYGMREQVREICAIKSAYSDIFGVGPLEKARITLGSVQLYLYFVLVKLGLWRAL